MALVLPFVNTERLVVVVVTTKFIYLLKAPGVLCGDQFMSYSLFSVYLCSLSGL